MGDPDAEELVTLQAPMFDGLSLDPFALADDGLGPAKVGVGGRHVVQAIVIPLVIVVLDERFDLAVEVAEQEVVFQQDAVLQRLTDLVTRYALHAVVEHRVLMTLRDADPMSRKETVS